MAWNEPENNGDKNKRPNENDAWGNRSGNRNQGPPDIDEVMASFIKKLTAMFGGSGKSRSGSSSSNGSGGIPSGLIAGILVIIGIVWAGSGIYTVDEQERGVVLRFGRALEGVVPPGLHWNPSLIDDVYQINVTRIFDENFSNSMLTEDDNIVDVTMSVQYQINDARAYILNVRDPIISLQQAAESAIRHEIGSSQMEQAMTSAREQIAQSVLARLQDYMELYGTGITVNQVNIAEVQQPGPVRAAYDDVIKAGEDKEAYQNEANAYANQVVPEARGYARRIIEEANAYRDETVARAEGEASRFDQLLVEYQRSPEVTRERLYLDALQSVMTSSTKIMIDVEGGGNNMMVLPLDQIMQPRSAPILNGSSNSFNSSDIRSLSNQVIQDIQSRSTTTTTRGTR